MEACRAPQMIILLQKVLLSDCNITSMPFASVHLTIYVSTYVRAFSVHAVPWQTITPTKSQNHEYNPPELRPKSEQRGERGERGITMAFSNSRSIFHFCKFHCHNILKILIFTVSDIDILNFAVL